MSLDEYFLQKKHILTNMFVGAYICPNLYSNFNKKQISVIKAAHARPVKQPQESIGSEM